MVDCETHLHGPRKYWPKCQLSRTHLGFLVYSSGSSHAWLIQVSHLTRRYSWPKIYCRVATPHPDIGSFSCTKEELCGFGVFDIPASYVPVLCTGSRSECRRPCRLGMSYYGTENVSFRLHQYYPGVVCVFYSMTGLSSYFVRCPCIPSTISFFISSHIVSPVVYLASRTLPWLTIRTLLLISWHICLSAM